MRTLECLHAAPSHPRPEFARQVGPTCLAFSATLPSNYKLGLASRLVAPTGPQQHGAPVKDQTVALSRGSGRTRDGPHPPTSVAMPWHCAPIKKPCGLALCVEVQVPNRLHGHCTCKSHRILCSTGESILSSRGRRICTRAERTPKWMSRSEMSPSQGLPVKQADASCKSKGKPITRLL